MPTKDEPNACFKMDLLFPLSPTFAQPIDFNEPSYGNYPNAIHWLSCGS